MSDPQAAYEQVKQKLRLRLADLLRNGARSEPFTWDRDTIAEQLHQLLTPPLTTSPPHRDTPSVVSLSSPAQERLIDEVFSDFVEGGALHELLADPNVTEILVNGPSHVYAERHGRLERTPVTFRDANHLMSLIERLLTSVGRSVNEAEPCVEASFPDGSRLHVVIPPVAMDGPVLTIRKKLTPLSMEDLIRLESLSLPAAHFLQACVRAHVNIVVSGGTSTGKTTLVNILARAIPSDQRVITIETVGELNLHSHEHWVRLVVRPPNLEGRGEVTIRTLVKNALRMRPDRLILGEARGGEALDIIQAMQTGHDGVITVVHANSPTAALERLEMLMLMSDVELPADFCKRQISSTIELVIHLVRGADGARRVAQIVQVAGASPEGFLSEELFGFQVRGVSPTGRIDGVLEATGVPPRFAHRLADHAVPRLQEGVQDA